MRGQLLAEIDHLPFQVKLGQARGQHRQNLVLLSNAERKLPHYRQLFQQDALARHQFERQEALVAHARDRPSPG